MDACETETGFQSGSEFHYRFLIDVENCTSNYTIVTIASYRNKTMLISSKTSLSPQSDPYSGKESIS